MEVEVLPEVRVKVLIQDTLDKAFVLLLLCLMVASLIQYYVMDYQVY